jgi:ribosomal protein L11 methyltransferase
MTVVAATADLTEAAALALVAAIEGDDALASFPLDLNETAPGRWQVAVYFEAPPGKIERAALARLAGGATVTFRALPDINWVAKSLEGLAPVRAGRFVVHGRHDRARLRANDIGIEIEAGLAFGTGHHGTTAGCLLAIDQVAKARPIGNALDLGTGSGVLAIAIAKRVRVPVVASDIDPVAVKVARENVRLNGCAQLVTTVTATGVNHPAIGTRAPFDLIVANILAGPLVALAPAIRRCLAPGGVVILSGILVSEQRRVAAAYRGQQLQFVRAIVLGEWATLVFRR